MKTRRFASKKLRETLISESRFSCAICGSRSYLELAHIIPSYLGGESTQDNMIVLCPTCHRSVDRAATISPELLKEVKVAWVEHGRPGREVILKNLSRIVLEPLQETGISSFGAQHELAHWLLALRKYSTFDDITTAIVGELASLRSEDEFINLYLKPILDWLGFQGITVLHHTGRAEHGKDIVFRDDDRLGGLSFYAVVATRERIHATSSKASSPGHYEKILDQVKKSYLLPYQDMNLKSSFFIDKVIVASADNITEEALLSFRAWEEKERRHLIYWNGPTIAGIMLKLRTRQTINSSNIV